MTAEERDVSAGALVTGGARGIGFEVVRQLAQQGMTVILGARDLDKAAVNALTSKLAAELEGTGILVNSVDPGLTATAPGMEEMGARPIPAGASSVAWAATLPDDGPSGSFFRDGEPMAW